ncbi:class I SAM-dependent methyltransferase [Actinophytocola sediminis]
MLTASECSTYRDFVEKYQLYLYKMLAGRVCRSLPETVSTIVDLGTGPGYLTAELALRTNAVVDAVDINPAMHELAAAEFAQAGVTDRVRIVDADVHALPFADGYADLVVSYSCFHHWADPVVALNECHRILRPGGLLYLVDTIRPHRLAVTGAALRQAIVEPEYFRFVDEALRESYPLTQVDELVTRSRIAEYELAGLRFDELDLLEAMDVLEARGEFPELNLAESDQVDVWYLTATKQKA